VHRLGDEDQGGVGSADRLANRRLRGKLRLPHLDEPHHADVRVARLADDLFELRKVAVSSSSSGKVAVTGGLDADDEIVVAHSFTLKSELLKSRLGAGCVDH
jgi:hypothetical protein